jgi:hypothetical protein
MIITALIYGESPISIIENLSSPQPIRAEKNARPWLLSSIHSKAAVFAPGTGITDKNLYTSTSTSVAIIFFLRLFIQRIDFIFL